MQTLARILPDMTGLQRRLQAAGGWLDLGLPQEAVQELAGVDDAHRLDFEVLALHVRVCRHLENWTRMLNLGRLLTDVRPHLASGALATAMATRHLHGPDRALGILMDAVEDYPHEAAVYYDLACCEAASGCLDNARLWLKEAFKLAPGLRAAARVDVDLAALHDVI